MADVTIAGGGLAVARYGFGAFSAATLVRYHGHSGSRFLNDGIFSDNKMPLQYHFDPSKKAEIVAASKQGFELAKLAYKPENTDRYEILKDKDGNLLRATDGWGLDVTAFRDKETGKVVIGIAGIETKYADGKADTVKDGFSAFDSTAGRISESMPNLIEFARKVKEQHGEISEISGHSLGGYEGMQLKILGDRTGLTSSDCKLFTYDMAGMTHGLAKNLSVQYGVTEQEITKSLYSKNVYSTINDLNSFNTLGAQPGNFLMATDPFKSQYQDHHISHLLPKRHTLPEFDKSFEKGEWYEAHNLGHARGPEYLTAFTAAGAVGAIHPYGYAIAAEPVLRNIQGSVTTAMGVNEKDYKRTLLRTTDPKIIDGMRPENAERPNMVAYEKLNNVYAQCYLDYVKAKGFNSKNMTEADDKEADDYARDPANLEAKIYANISSSQAALDARSGFTKFTEGAMVVNAKYIGGFIAGEMAIGDLSLSPEALKIKESSSALQELQIYKQDFSKYQEAEKARTSFIQQAVDAAPKSVTLGDAEVAPPNAAVKGFGVNQGLA